MGATRFVARERLVSDVALSIGGVPVGAADEIEQGTVARRDRAEGRGVELRMAGAASYRDLQLAFAGGDRARADSIAIVDGEAVLTPDRWLTAEGFHGHRHA
jgi:hypothetical protein